MPKNVEDIYEVTPLQEGMLFHSLYSPDSSVYNTVLRWGLQGNLDFESLKNAWSFLIQRHPPLRTCFVWEDLERPYQVVRQEVPDSIFEHDWRGRAADQRAQDWEALCQSEHQFRFDLKVAPLSRLSLVRFSDTETRVVWTFHHVVLEGWSAAIVLGEFRRKYQELAGGPPASLEEPPRFADYIRWLQQKNAEPSQAERYWRKHLQGMTAPTHLPIDKASGDVPAHVVTTAEETFSLDPPASEALRQFARKQRMTMSSVIQGAWALLLARYTGDRQVVSGTVVSGRPAELPGAESMVGMFVNTLPFRVNVPDEGPVADFLTALQKAQAELREFEHCSLAWVQERTKIPRGQPLFDSVVVFENWLGDLGAAQWSDSVPISFLEARTGSDHPLALIAQPGDSIRFHLRYDVDRFDRSAIQRMLGHLLTLLNDMAQRPDCSLRELQWVSDAERQQLLKEWNPAPRDYPRDANIPELFEARAKAHPDSLAVEFEGATLTYRELNEAANRRAHQLQQSGVQQDTMVGLCVERSLEMVVGILAILKAGATYVPLDPTYPWPRLQWMIDDTQTPVLLTQKRFAEKLSEFRGKQLCLEEDASSYPATPPTIASSAESLAYVMYTSGSTGKPKGTCVPHRAIVRLVHETNYLEFGPDQVFLQFAPISFDASTLELWGSLLHGAKLVVFPPEVPALEDLAEFLKTHQITTLWLTSALFTQMVDSHRDALSEIQQLLAGGDALSVPHVKAVLEGLGSRKLINGYGPTENTTFTCCHPMSADTVIDTSVPIGRPIAHTTVYVLDRFGTPVPIGVPGELCTGGDGVARGYWNNVALSEERFVSDPFSSMPGAKMYRTGDLVRFREDGVLEFLGRRDHQVKVRGFRIETGEIEAALLEHPSVQETVVVCREDEPGDRRLVAYLVAGKDSSSNPQSLRRFLQESLPEYMIPSTFQPMDALPVSPNGKIDRAALPAPTRERTLTEEYLQPTNETEQAIARVWGEVLKVEQVGVKDNFFDLGGNSLLLVQAHRKVCQALSREIPITDMFRHPTVKSLASGLRDTGSAPTSPTAGVATRANQQRAAQQARRQRMQGRKRPR